MRPQKFLALFVASADAFSTQLGKRINPGEGSFLDFARLAEPVIQRRDVSLKRQDTVGAWSLRTVKCPDTTNSCENMGFPAMEACCPKNLVCVYYLFRLACCSTESSCIATAGTFPKCGDPSWTLWAGSREEFFCCLSGEIGYVTTDNSAACGPSSLKPTGKQIATLIDQNNEDPSPTSVPDPGDNGTSSSPLPNTTSDTTSTPDTTGTSDTTSTSSGSVNPPVTNVPNGTDDEPTNTPDNSNDNGTTNSSSSSNGGLATGAIAGIAAGGILLLILAGVGIFFALRAGRKRGAKEALAAFQQQERSLPGPDYDHRNPSYHSHSGPTTPGVLVAGNQAKFGEEAEVKTQVMPGVAEKYGEGVQPPAPVASPPPQQYQWNGPQEGAPRYEADATNIYPNQRYAEMEGYHNQHR